MVADSKQLVDALKQSAAFHEESPRTQLRLIEKKKTSTKGLLLRKCPLAPTPGIWFVYLVINAALEEEEPQVVVVVADKLGPRLEPLQFGLEPSRRRKHGPGRSTVSEGMSNVEQSEFWSRHPN